ncbi:hypothetical protein Tco_0046271 [Tanacetum coccineum]
MELENSVAKLLLENERLCNKINHVKQVFKELFDSIKKTRIRTKEQSDSLIDKLNLKSAENEDLKAQIQDKNGQKAKAKQPLDKELDFASSILALQFCLGTCLDHLGRRHELGELWDCQLGNFTAGKDSGGGGRGLTMGELGLQGKRKVVKPVSCGS